MFTEMSLLKDTANGVYESIPDIEATSSSDELQLLKKPPPPPHRIKGKGRCIKYKSFSWGIIVGVALGFGFVPFYDIFTGLYFYVSQSKVHHRHTHHSVRGIHRRGPRHSGALYNLLHGPIHRAKVSIGPRPYFLINEMDDDDNAGAGFVRPKLKETLQQCAQSLKSFQPSDFVLGHRGAALQFPEHSDRSHDAASRMGAGLVECDVNLTKDKKLVCRHERCDLHLTTDVLTIPHLARKCTKPFKPASSSPPQHRSASAKCCTTDFTLEEIQSQMCSRMSSYNKHARTAHEYISRKNTPSYRTNLYSHDCPHVQSHQDFIEVVNANGGSFVAEFKMLDYDFTTRKDGYTRQMFIDQILADYENVTHASERVYPQGFEWEDLYYVANNTVFNKNTFALDKNLFAVSYTRKQLHQYFMQLVEGGVTAVAPAMFMLLDITKEGNVIPSLYAEVAKEVGLDIVAWTLERSDALAYSQSSWYYSKLSEVLKTDSDMLKVLDVLYEDVGAKAIFTDWPSVVTFYANCKGIALR